MKPGTELAQLAMISYTVNCYISLPCTHIPGSTSGIATHLGLSRSDKIETALKYLVKIDFINTTSGYDLFWLTRKEPLHNMLIDEFFIAGISTDVSKRPPVFRMEMPLIPYPPAQLQS